MRSDTGPGIRLLLHLVTGIPCKRAILDGSLD